MMSRSLQVGGEIHDGLQAQLDTALIFVDDLFAVPIKALWSMK